jgi:hypothetical protein
MVNGRAFDWESLTIQMLVGGIAPYTLDNIKSIDWSDTRGITPTYGAGGAPRAWGRRNYRAQGSMELADKTYGDLLGFAAAFGGFYNMQFTGHLQYGDNPYSTGYQEQHDVMLLQCIPARRGGASRQGTAESRIVRVEFEILGGITDLDLNELGKVA